VRGHLANETEHWFRGATVTLSPAQSWAICAVEAEYIPKEDEISSKEIGEFLPKKWGEIWFPERVEYRSVTEAKDGKVYGSQKRSIEFRSAQRHQELTKHDFTLAIHSLPEIAPAGAGKDPDPRWRGFRTVAIFTATAVLATILIWVLKRRQQTTR
jgi:hypothetical protein